MRISDWSSDVCSSDLLPPIFATEPLEMIGQLRDGDVVVVWKLDRLSRSLKDMLHIMERIELAGAGFRSLTEAIATTPAAGRMMMQIGRASCRERGGRKG